MPIAKQKRIWSVGNYLNHLRHFHGPNSIVIASHRDIPIRKSAVIYDDLSRFDIFSFDAQGKYLGSKQRKTGHIQCY